MFGYVVTNQPELKIREFQEYRSHYCGLCRTLKERYGLMARLTLNYDMTFLVMLLTSLYEPEIHCCERRCLAHGCMKQQERTSEIGGYAADMNVLLAWYNCLDDWKDDRNVFKYLLARILERKLKKRNISGEKAETIREFLDELEMMEKENSPDLEVASVIFGNIMGEIFVMKDDLWAKDLYGCGFYLGKFIYILDALDDLEKDRKKGSYNPILLHEGEEGYLEKVEQMLNLSAARSAEHFEHLPVIDDIEIMRNILYAGIWSRYEKLKENGRNESI